MPSSKPLASNSHPFTFASMIPLLMKQHMDVPTTTILVVIVLPVKWHMETLVETLMILMISSGISLTMILGRIPSPCPQNSGLFDMIL
jgi:hypothetical protein